MNKELIFIIANTDTNRLMDQMIEECAELIQACTKVKRSLRGDASIQADAAYGMLVEEMADVLNVQRVTADRVLTSAERVRMEEIKDQKMQRWAERIRNERGKDGE